MHGLSFQQLVVRQPIKMGGMGLKSLVQIRSAAFVGSVEQFVPELGTSAGLCTELIYMFGGDDRFARGSPVNNRWRFILRSGRRPEAEYRQAWEDIQLAVCRLLGKNHYSSVHIFL